VNWYKKSQADSAALVLMVMMQKASQPGYLFEDELMKFQDYQPEEIHNAIASTYAQFPELNEQQQNILWHLQRMLTGTDGNMQQQGENDDQNIPEGIPGEEQSFD
jgi:hypothetical protein